MSKRLSPSPAGAGGTTLSNAEAVARLFDDLSSRIRAIEDGSNRGPGSSFGLPFKLVGPNGTFTFFVNGVGQLCIQSPSTAVTVIAPP